MSQSRERTTTKSHTLAHARASMDGRNEEQEGLHVDIPQESLGMARLIFPHLPNCIFEIQNEPQSGQDLIALLGETEARTGFLGREARPDGRLDRLPRTEGQDRLSRPRMKEHRGPLLCAGVHRLLATVGNGWPYLYARGNGGGWRHAWSSCNCREARG